MIKSAKRAVKKDQLKSADISDEEILSAFAGAKGLIIQGLLHISQMIHRMYHQLLQTISYLVSLVVSLLQKWKSRSTIMLREDGGMFISCYNASGNVGC